MAKRLPKLTNAVARDIVVRQEKTHRAINEANMRELDVLLAAMQEKFATPVSPEETNG